MAKYTINHTCGHQTIENIIGTNVHGERDRKIAWLENRLCPECYARQQAGENGTFEEVEMLYRAYKAEYATCKTKPGSYDAVQKTVIVYVPIAAAREEPESEDIAGTSPYTGEKIWHQMSIKEQTAAVRAVGEDIKKRTASLAAQRGVECVKEAAAVDSVVAKIISRLPAQTHRTLPYETMWQGINDIANFVRCNDHWGSEMNAVAAILFMQTLAENEDKGDA